MKKSFTLFSVSALFLMLLFPVSVKAAPIVLYFGYQDGQWTQNSEVAQPAECCAGYIAASDKIVTGSDFYYSGKQYEAVERDGDDWTGFNGSNGTVTACTRNTVSLSATTYTFSLLTKDKGEMDITLPKISIDGTNYVEPQKVLVNSVEQSFSNNQYRYTANEETVLEYSIKITSADSYTISVQFTSGWRDKFKASTLTITQNAPAAPTYEVSATASNGTVSGTGSYTEGAEVTLTASPNENYSFTGWSSSDISIADASANPLVFSMPANAVSVTANFAACTKHTVTLAANNNEYGSVSGGGEQCDGSVTVTATPNSGYRFVNWTNTSTSAEVSTDAEYTFTLSADISLTANFEVDPCSNSLTIQCESNYVVVTVHGNADEAATPDVQDGYVQTVDENHWYAYYYPVTISSDLSSFNFNVRLARSSDNNSYINVFKKTNEGSGNVEYAGAYYNKLGWKKLATGDWNNNWFTVDVASFDDSGSGFSTLSAGEYLVALSGRYQVKLDYFTLTASENIFCPNTITMAKSGDDGAAAPTAQVNSSNVTTAFEGAVVTVTAAAASAGYNFSGWTASPAVTFADASATSTTFTMPASAVTITANYEATATSAFSYTTSGSGSITCATASGSSVVSGTAIPMTAVPSTDYVFTGWTATAGSFSNESALTTNFTMPASAATVTANFAQVDNTIIAGSTASTEGFDGDGSGTMNITSVADFDAFNHNVLKFAYSNMSGNYKGQKIFIDGGYSSSASAQATGFGFYYKTEKEDDHVAFCFEVSSGQQVKWQLAATNNEWKYFYFPHAGANSWNGGHIAIFMNGDDTGNYSTWNGQGTHTTYKDGGAFYMSEIAATSITSKPDIDTYHYTYNRGSAMQVNDYGTLCLPMAGTIAGATLYSIAGKEVDGGTAYVVLEDKGTAVEAGKPYITQSTATSYTVTMGGVHSDVQAENGLVGTYTEINQLEQYAAEGPHNYVLWSNSFKKVGANISVGAYRAYLNFDAISAAPAPAPGAQYVRMAIEGTDIQTGIETVNGEWVNGESAKILRGGHLFILRDGKTYNAQGQMIK